MDGVVCNFYLNMLVSVVVHMTAINAHVMCWSITSLFLTHIRSTSVIFLFLQHSSF